MATTTKQYQIMQKTAANEFLKIHPETDAEIVLLASEKLTSTNLKDAVEELYNLVSDITGGGVVTGVKGSAETEYRLGNVNITAENIGLGSVDNTADADKPISTATQSALDEKQDKLTFDTAPTESSTNPVTSGGVYAALAGKQDTLTIDDSVTAASSNAVKSSGIYSAIETAKTEVEAEIPDVSEFITKAVSDLANYYTKTQIDSTVDDLEGKISAIPKFAISVVDSLPTSDISETTIYLVKSGDESSNLYTEYIYVNSGWEELGTQSVDLTDYVTTSALNTAIADFLTESDVSGLINTALASYYTKTEVDTALSKKQDTLSFDSTPTAESTNPVTSGGVFTALSGKQDTLTIDTELSASSTNPVQNQAITAGINSASSAAATAQTAADNAQSAADDAATAASNAQSTANTAVANAATAQSAAETAQSGVDEINESLEDTTVTGSYSAVSVNAAGVVVTGAQVVEVWASGQTTSDTLAVGGIAFVEV